MPFFEKATDKYIRFDWAAAKKMLQKGFSVEDIQELTGLSANEIESL